MKNKFWKTVCVLLVCGLMTSMNSCKKDPVTPDSDDAVLLEVLKGFTNNTVIKTYGLLADRSMELLTLCEDLQASKTNVNVAAAAQKWIEARKYWEMTEAFLFGPAEFYALDPHIDSWPLDKDQLDQVLTNPNIADVDAAYARTYYGESLLGFHAIEYVLFEDGQAKDVSKITDAELSFLVAVAGVLQEDCIRLEAAWNSNISSAKKTILEDAELDIPPDFGSEMINAGSAGSRFRTPQQAVREMVGGCETIADEVGNEKIADPYTTKNVLTVESWYSWNSITDFTDNIRSIENVYLGGIEGSRSGTSLSVYVQGKNAQLDADIRAAIQNAKAKIQAIPAPFRNHLSDSDAQIEAAMDACNALMDQLSLIDGIIE
ncbi:MAG: peptidase M75 [Bacteroidales bacterium]|jgi:predicted lipoprotein|nr:peptidase M75 [Bacteroidales bacterium]